MVQTVDLSNVLTTLAPYYQTRKRKGHLLLCYFLTRHSGRRETGGLTGKSFFKLFIICYLFQELLCQHDAVMKISTQLCHFINDGTRVFTGHALINKTSL